MNGVRLWINAARLRRRRRRCSLPGVDWRKRQREWIREHAPGRSFADVGGLYELAGDVALLAEEAGATEVTLFDSGDALFTEFPGRRRPGARAYFGTHTIPEVPGIRHACVYYPYLDDASRAAYAAAHKGSDPLWGIHTPFGDRPMSGHGNF